MKVTDLYHAEVFKALAYQNKPPVIPDEINVPTARSLLGYFNLFLPYVPSLSQKTEALRSMITKPHLPKKSWSEIRPEIVSLLDECTDHIRLGYHSPREPIIAYTDYATSGFGYIITQQNQPIFQGSKAVTEADHTLAVWEGELLCLLLVLDRLHGYRTPGQPLIWRTDSKALVGWKNMKITETRRHVKYALQMISEHHVQVEYIEGTRNPADYLSRHPSPAYEDPGPLMPYVSWDPLLEKD
eukprot:GHVO01003009.1.p1 GENE.GHVO01003009.1~~GHVO01003009.1.p1  ORF type:complete len:242 (-),score=10.24 GHVO01003009.1:141-866(-)